MQRHERLECTVTVAVAADIVYKFAVHESSHAPLFIVSLVAIVACIKLYEIASAKIRDAERVLDDIEE